MKYIRGELLSCINKIQNVSRAVDEMRNCACEKDLATARKEIADIAFDITLDLSIVARALNDLAESAGNIS